MSGGDRTRPFVVRSGGGSSAHAAHIVQSAIDEVFRMLFVSTARRTELSAATEKNNIYERKARAYVGAVRALAVTATQ
jgi:hypothetical protein